MNPETFRIRIKYYEHSSKSRKFWLLIDTKVIKTIKDVLLEVLQHIDGSENRSHICMSTMPLMATLNKYQLRPNESIFVLRDADKLVIKQEHVKKLDLSIDINSDLAEQVYQEMKKLKRKEKQRSAAETAQSIDGENADEDSLTAKRQKREKNHKSTTNEQLLEDNTVDTVKDFDCMEKQKMEKYEKYDANNQPSEKECAGKGKDSVASQIASYMKENSIKCPEANIETAKERQNLSNTIGTDNTSCTLPAKKKRKRTRKKKQDPRSESFTYTSHGEEAVSASLNYMSGGGVQKRSISYSLSSQSNSHTYFEDKDQDGDSQTLQTPVTSQVNDLEKQLNGVNMSPQDLSKSFVSNAGGESSNCTSLTNISVTQPKSNCNFQTASEIMSSHISTEYTVIPPVDTRKYPHLRGKDLVAGAKVFNRVNLKKRKSTLKQTEAGTIRQQVHEDMDTSDVDISSTKAKLNKPGGTAPVLTNTPTPADTSVPSKEIDNQDHAKENLFLSVDFGALPPFTGQPETGVTIAFKMLEMTNIYCPEVSEYKVAEIISYDKRSDTVELKMKHQSSQRELGKFDVCVEYEDEILTGVDTQSVINLPWNNVLQPKLLSQG